jgi:thioredoxin-related protein
MNLSHSLMLFSLLSVYALAGAATRDPDSHFFDQSLGDFREELQTARDEGKKGILIMFEMDDCPFCHRMKTKVLNQVEVQDYFKGNFLIFPVDIEGDVMITDFQGDTLAEKDFAFKQYRVRATPVFAFFDLDGKLMARYTGATSDDREFLWLGEFVADGHYLQSNFSRFKRNKKQGLRAK